MYTSTSKMARTQNQSEKILKYLQSNIIPTNFVGKPRRIDRLPVHINVFQYLLMNINLRSTPNIEVWNNNYTITLISTLPSSSPTFLHHFFLYFYSFFPIFGSIHVRVSLLCMFCFLGVFCLFFFLSWTTQTGGGTHFKTHSRPIFLLFS